MGNGILYLEFKLKIEFPHLSLLCIQFLFFFCNCKMWHFVPKRKYGVENDVGILLNMFYFYSGFLIRHIIIWAKIDMHTHIIFPHSISCGSVDSEMLWHGVIVCHRSLRVLLWQANLWMGVALDVHLSRMKWSCQHFLHVCSLTALIIL